MKNRIIILIIFFASLQLFAQTKTNLENIIGLINKSVVKIDSVAGSSKLAAVSVISSLPLDVLKLKVIEKFSENGYKLKNEAAAGDLKISYTLLSVGVEYSDIRKEGFFGSTFVDRNISLKGSAVVTLKDGIDKPIEINESIKDVVNIDDIRSLEDLTLPFTQAPIPQISFFSNLLEPIIVVGTLIGTVILLFTVRGK